MKEIEDKIGIIVEKPKFKGYTIEEIRYQRALVAMRKEFCKVKLMESIERLRPKSSKKEPAVTFMTGSSTKTLFSRVATTVFKSMNSIDYVLLGISAFSTIRKGIKMLKRKKQKK